MSGVSVKRSLFRFVAENVPHADLDLIDDIVLEYVTSVVEEASKEPRIDVDAFIEMMSAYFPQFAAVEPAAVCAWLFQLEAEVNGGQEGREDDDDDGGAKLDAALHALSSALPTVAPRGNHAEAVDEAASEEETTVYLAYAPACHLLQDMFPNACPVEIQQCVSIACGDVERAASLVLHRRESGQARTAPSLPPPPSRHHHTLNDVELKTRIIDRYSYVDKNADFKDHKPLVPKIEPKKLVRYRDNKIVSLRGERYTEVSRSGNDDEASLKKPKRPHCPP